MLKKKNRALRAQTLHKFRARCVRGPSLPDIQMNKKLSHVAIITVTLEVGIYTAFVAVGTFFDHHSGGDTEMQLPFKQPFPFYSTYYILHIFT